MQEKIKFILDAAGDLTLEDVANNPITIVPAYVHIEDKPVTRDLIGISPEDYWEVLKTCRVPPHTSMAPPVEWVAAYKEAYLEGYTHIIVTTVSSTASGVFGAAVMAIDMLRDEEGITDIVIEPLDCLAYTAMYGDTILRGCEMAKEGVPFAEILAKMKNICNKVEAVFSVYTLKFLKICGRVNGVSAFAGEALGIRPVLRASGGSINPCDKVRGDKNIVNGVMTNLKKFINPDDPEQRISILYTDVPKEHIDELEKRIKEEYCIKDIRYFALGSSITTNCGPHCLGVVYYGNPR